MQTLLRKRPTEILKDINMTQTAPILIAGAGPAGLVLALALRQNGVPVRIIDKEPKHHLGARAAGIMPRTLEFYDFLGVLPDIMKASTQPPMFCAYKLPGGTEIEETYPMFLSNEPALDRPYLNPRILSQDINQAVLRSHLAKYDTLVELGTALRDFEDKGDHVVASVVKKGPDGAERSESYVASYLVGADGARGVVRNRLGMAFDGEAYEGLNMVFSDVRIAGLGGEYWHKWGEMSDRMVTLRQTEEGDRFWVLGGGRQMDTANLRGEPESMTQWIADVTGRRDIKVTEVLTFASYKLSRLAVDSEFSKGRVYLAGDAAHIHSPAGGQGMNNGISDAFSLAWRLSLAYKSLASTELMSSYSAERAPIIKTMLQRTTALLENSSISWGKFALKMGPKDKLPLFQLDLHYRWSPVIVDGMREKAPPNAGPNGNMNQGGIVLAGDRAPDAPGLVDLTGNDSSMKTLFRYFKPTHHTALLFTSSTGSLDAFVSALKQVPGGVVRSTVVLPGTASVRPDTQAEVDWRSRADCALKDCEGHAYDVYCVGARGGDVAVIVRPDGYIGAIVKDGEGVAKYFRKIVAA
ncbi:FAD/NAD(P)-binding domain-containing protein [Heliocybe sulcata]|uniref:FAD/NAD(P)-binding domain-containing protein n=1 Tax=Heliocybe sulcata TaxID=5364 RepID=A0A5C3MT59_9AGAM|nr:FAD/NAD(P)-binding domain-containing protein [Heliocybe sulcata]